MYFDIQLVSGVMTRRRWAGAWASPREHGRGRGRGRASRAHGHYPAEPRARMGMAWPSLARAWAFPGRASRAHGHYLA